MINEDRVKLLVDALRSGEFKQGVMGLAFQYNDYVKYCCLGVACEVALRNGVKVKKFVPTMSKIPHFSSAKISYDDEDLFLPRKIVNWYGFESVNPIICDVGSSYANDTLRWDFTRIADAIERTYLNGC